MKKTILAVAVSTFLAACVGGCGGGGSDVITVPITPPVQLPWALTKLSDGGGVTSTTSACGSYDIVAKGDLNGDGHEDILIGPKARYKPDSGCSDPGFTKLLVAYYDPVTKKYGTKSATQQVMPEMQWTSMATIADFNGDGYADIFAVGTGTDYGQPCGEAPILLLGSSNGFTNASHLLPRYSTYTHQAAWGDFNGDGKTDFVILNNNWVPSNPTDPEQQKCNYRRHPGSNDSFIVLSSNNTWVSQKFVLKDKSGAVVIGGNESFNSAVAGDIDGDGKTDLMIFGPNFYSPLQQKNLTLLGKGNGEFELASVFSETPFGANTVAINPNIKQLDGQGPAELLVNYAEHPGGPERPFQNSVYRVFKYNATTSSWINSTDQFLSNKTGVTETDLTYCARMYWVDLNSDGNEDFTCTTMNPMTTDNTAIMSPRMWVKGQDGKFVPAYHRDFSMIGLMASPTPVKIDGKIKIVGMRNNNFGQSIQLHIAE